MYSILQVCSELLGAWSILGASVEHLNRYVRLAIEHPCVLRAAEAAALPHRCVLCRYGLRTYANMTKVKSSCRGTGTWYCCTRSPYLAPKQNLVATAMRAHVAVPRCVALSASSVSRKPVYVRTNP